MDAIIFGAGTERDLVQGVPQSLFSVSCNLAYTNANVYFAQDDQMINELIRKKVKALFLTFRMYENIQIIQMLVFSYWMRINYGIDLKDYRQAY